MGFDIAKGANASKERELATRTTRLEDAARLVQAVFDDVHDGKKPVKVLDDLVRAARGQLNNDSSSPDENAMDPKAAMQIVLASDKVPQEAKHLLRRALTPSDPEHIPVDDRGTPLEIKTLRDRVQELERETLTSTTQDLPKLATALDLKDDASFNDVITSAKNAQAYREVAGALQHKVKEITGLDMENNESHHDYVVRGLQHTNRRRGFGRGNR